MSYWVLNDSYIPLRPLEDALKSPWGTSMRLRSLFERLNRIREWIERKEEAEEEGKKREAKKEKKMNERTNK